MLLDAHAHVDEYGSQTKQALGQIRLHQIVTLAVSMDVASYKWTRKIAGSCEYIIPLFGIHPWKAPDFHDDPESLLPLINKSPLIGEIGLDHRFVKDTSAYPKQRRIFDFFMDAAARKGKIVNLHTSGAEKEIVEKLEEYPSSCSIVHWYNGPLDLIDRYLSAGAWFTIGVEVLFSGRIRQILEQIPADRLLTETDNPSGYHWLTEKTGMPVVLLDVIRKIAQIMKKEEKEVVHLVENNFKMMIRSNRHLTETWNRLENQREAGN